MSIADKLLIVAENVGKVYEAGKKAGGGICNVDHEELYNKGYADGQSNSAEVPNPLEHATTVSYREVEFPTDYELVINTPLLTSLSYSFYNTKGIKNVTIQGNDNENTIDFSNSFRNSADIEVLDLTEFVAKVSSGNSAFHTARKLREILGELDFTECTNTNTMFQNCSVLEEVRLKENSLKMSISFSASPLLSANSIQSIIDGLATVETQQILTLHSDVSFVLTNEQHEQISNKNWRLE